MSIFEYDEEKVIAMIRQEERLEGIQEGRQEGLQEGRQEGFVQGIEAGIQALILDNLAEGTSEERILCKLEKLFQLTREQARDYLDRYSKMQEKLS